MQHGMSSVCRSVPILVTSLYFDKAINENKSCSWLHLGMHLAHTYFVRHSEFTVNKRHILYAALTPLKG